MAGGLIQVPMTTTAFRSWFDPLEQLTAAFAASKMSFGH